MKEAILIGNGPSAITYQFQNKIDFGNHTIYRFNKFALKGFEQFIGTRFDIWVTHCWWDNEILPSKALIWSGFPWEDQQRITLNNQNLINKLKEKRIPYTFINTTLLQSLYNVANAKFIPSTGLILLNELIVKKIYDRIYLVGFDCFAASNHHYFPDNDDCGKHDANIERKVINRFLHYGSIKFLNE